MTQAKQHKWFNLRLYVDMLRQLKLVGFILAGACVVITLLPPAVNLIDGYTPGEIHIAEIAPALWGFLYIGGDQVRLLPALNIPWELLKEAVQVLMEVCAG